MAAQTFDLAVLGSGPGGYVAAIRAAQLGMKIALVERAELGGICLNWGCIPTKALLRASEINHLLYDLDRFGFAADTVRFDLPKVVARSRAVAAQLAAGVAHLLKKHGVSVFKGDGELLGGHAMRVSVGGKSVAELEAPHIILATGARARPLPGFEADGRLVWTYREALLPDCVPRRLLVIGAGAIGIEFASFFANMGSAVTVVETLPRILPAEDEEISGLAAKLFAQQGITIHTGATVKLLGKDGAQARVAITAGASTLDERFDRVISAVGIVGNVENIGLEHTRVAVERTHVVTDAHCRTAEPGIYAIGDLCGPPWLAHKASHEAVLCVETIAGVEGTHPLDPGNIPGCTYCRPQIASIGLTEAQARAGGREIRVGRFPLRANGRAIALGETEGMVKTVFDARSGALLGAHMIGPEVTEMIQGYAIARTLEATEAELIATVFPHPTVSEAMHESVLDAYGRVLHL